MAIVGTVFHTGLIRVGLSLSVFAQAPDGGVCARRVQLCISFHGLWNAAGLCNAE